jgi:hypothetical protein
VEAFDMIREGVFGEVEYFKDLVDSVNKIPECGNDWFLVANDFAAYMDAQVGLVYTVTVVSYHEHLAKYSPPNQHGQSYNLVLNSVRKNGLFFGLSTDFLIG